MATEYMPLLLLIVFAGVLGGLFIILGWLFGPKMITPYKQSTYESGMTPLGTARERFPVKFYLVAMLFILFDVEVIFLWSWLTVFRNASIEYQVFSFWAVMIYLFLWVVGDAYILRVNAIEWDEAHSLEESKSGLLTGSQLERTRSREIA
jgi:NADH-quinone oxidoreductase subunit A